MNSNPATETSSICQEAAANQKKGRSGRELGKTRGFGKKERIYTIRANNEGIDPI